MVPNKNKVSTIFQDNGNTITIPFNTDNAESLPLTLTAI